MDLAEQRKAVLPLIRQAMPKVAALVAALRAQRGDAFVQECQKRGLGGEPGWFYAREGVLTVGVPWEASRNIERELEAAGTGYAGAAFVVLREQEPGAAHGAH